MPKVMPARFRAQLEQQLWEADFQHRRLLIASDFLAGRAGVAETHDRMYALMTERRPSRSGEGWPEHA